MSQLVCNRESNLAPKDSTATNETGSSEKFRLVDWLLESTPKIPASDAVVLPGLSLFDSADESDRVIVRRNSLEHVAYYKAQQASVRFNRGNKVGSGFFISDDGLIVTASHVVPEGQAEVNVNTVNGTKYSARLISRDVNNDLALFKIIESGKAAKFPFLSLNVKDAYSEKLAATGHPNGWPSMYISMGLAQSKPFKPGKGEKSDELMGIYAHVEGGNSGGAVIDGCGSVRGVLVRGGVGLLALAVPSKSIDKLVRWTDSAPTAGINHEGGYRLADYELAQGSKNGTPEVKQLPIEQQAPKAPTADSPNEQLEDRKQHKPDTKELFKNPGPGGFTSPYGKIYRNPTNFYEQKKFD